MEDNTGKRGVGCLYGIGVGPGDPELLTVKASRILSRVPVIFAPQRDGSSGSYAGRIIAQTIGNSGQRVVELIFPMSRDAAKLAGHWDAAVEAMWLHLQTGQDCAFVAEGDCFLYGTFVHVFEVMRRKHPEARIEVVPGVSSINAAAARALFPIAAGGERVAILPATCPDEVIRRTLSDFDAVVFLKIGSVFDRVLHILQELDMVDKCACVTRCTTEDEQIVRCISDLEGRDLDYFSLLLVRR